jgi:hypothetical protein
MVQLNHRDCSWELVRQFDEASSASIFDWFIQREKGGTDMAKYIDRHPTDPNLPQEVLAQVQARLARGDIDEFGERGINVFVGPRWTYCHTEAPNMDSVQKSHLALGIVLEIEDIEEVQVLP